MGSITKGLAAGAVGTELLNVATYIDMAARARGASSTPQEDVERLANRADIDLGEGEVRENRKTAIGTLMGYATGASVGVVYGVLRPALRSLPRTPAAVLVGLAAMAATDATSAALGTTDPRSWTASEWLSDVLPHLAFGAGLVATYDALDGHAR
jgi:hypothetical protein